MNSDEALKLLDEVAACSQRTIKEEILGKFKDDPFFRSVLIAALDPFTTYGVTSVKAGVAGSKTFDVLPAELDGLATRMLSGNAAAIALTQLTEPMTLASQELIRRIVTKDLRAGFTSGTCNRVEPGMIPVFDMMLAHKYEEKRIKKWPVAVEPKLDGVRVACLVQGLNVQFLSRNGKPFPAVEHLKPKMLDWLKAIDMDGRDLFFDGEITSGNFNKTVGDVRRKDKAALDSIFNVFDGLNLVEFENEQPASPYISRRGWLEELFGRADPEAWPFKLVPRYLASSYDEVQFYYQAFRAAGQEGAIVKPLDGVYAKKRSHAWLKIKNEETHDLVITGAFEGTGKYVGMLGGVIVDFNGVEVRVGGGFSDAQRAELWADYKSDKRVFGGSHFKLLGRMIEVEAHEVTPDGSLRHPRFVRWRDDKAPMKEAA